MKKSVVYFILYLRIGAWRSLVARTAGGREVAGSNPVAPIFLPIERGKGIFYAAPVN